MEPNLSKTPRFFEVMNPENHLEIQLSFLPENKKDHLKERKEIDTLPEPVKRSKSQGTKLSAQHLQDLQFLESWVSGKSKHTRRGYLRVGEELLAGLHPKSLQETTLQTLQLFLDVRSYRKEGSKTQRAAIIKSLFSFGVKTGYLPANIGSFLPKIKLQSHLTECYLSEEEVMRMIHLTSNLRDRAIIKTLYAGGLRISELLGLNWEHLQARENGTGQITILGKGNKKRVVVLSDGIFQDLLNLKGLPAYDFDPIFTSRQEGHSRLSSRMAQVIIDEARLRAGISKKVSPHWLSHAHASHALDRGAPIHLVQSTLGHASVATTGKDLHSRPQESSGRFLGI